MSATPTHPAADLFPLMSDGEFESLKTDIANNGLREPIVLCEGKILDGRNRFRACEQLGIEPKFTAYEGDSPVAFVWSLNGERRNLTKSQRAAIGVEMLPHLETEAKKRVGGRPANGEQKPIVKLREVCVSVAIAGKRVGVGESMVQRGKRVKEEDPALFEQVKRGEVAVESAYQKVTKGKPVPPKPRNVPQEERAMQISKLAAQGNRAEQIADELGIKEQQVRKIARLQHITLPDAAIGRPHKIDAHRVIETTVHGLEGYAQGLQTINGGIASVDRETAGTWAESLKTSLASINRLRKQLTRHSHGN